MPSCSVEPSSMRLATSSAICSACSCPGPIAGEGSSSCDLDREVDEVLVQLAVAERVGHPRVAAGRSPGRHAHGRARPRPGGCSPRSRARPYPRRGVEVCSSTTSGGRMRREQPWDERKAHRQVVQPLTGAAHSRSDERRLEDHAVACGQRGLRGEHEQPVALHRPLQRIQQSSRGGEVPARDDSAAPEAESPARASSSCCSETTLTAGTLRAPTGARHG